MTRVLKALLIAVLVLLSVPTIIDYYDIYKNGDTDRPVTLEGPAVDAQAKFTTDIAQLINYADALGYQLTFGEAWRTRYQQRHNIATGVSWTMNSNHLKRRAVDFNLFVDGEYKRDCSYYAILGEFWESLDELNVWGGHFSDAPHFERRDSLAQAKKYRLRYKCR
jgi:hypothetical protein